MTVRFIAGNKVKKRLFILGISRLPKLWLKSRITLFFYFFEQLMCKIKKASSNYDK